MRVLSSLTAALNTTIGLIWEELNGCLGRSILRLSPFYVSEEELQRLGRATDEIARAAALRIFAQPVEIEVELIGGTLKGKIKATGLFVAGAVGIYASIGGAIDTTENSAKFRVHFTNMCATNSLKSLARRDTKFE